MSVAEKTDGQAWFDLLIPQVPTADRQIILKAIRDADETDFDALALSSAAGRLLALDLARANHAQDAVPTLEAYDETKALGAIPKSLPEHHNSAGSETAIKLAYRLIQRRAPTKAELTLWCEKLEGDVRFEDFFLALHSAGESVEGAGAAVGGGMSHADFIQSVYNLTEDRGALPSEIEHYRSMLIAGRISRADILTGFFNAAADRMQRAEPEMLHDGLSCAIMGTNRILHISEWQTRAKDADALAEAKAQLRPKTPYTITGDGLRVGAITSLFKGGDFIEQFMENITSQTCFDRHAELLIIDADSPEGEAEVIQRFTRDHPNIHYRRTDTCIGIYEAWNLGVQMSKAPYLTNANLDDLRRADSFEIQAGALDTHSYVDVVYQDFFYSFEPSLTWEETAAFGYQSDLPVVTPYTMLRFNAPHNAPMWRRTLHDELGLFDASYKSAGDYEFWMRCMVAGKTFFKVNEPHVVYYQNPKGLSTRADTRGLVEGRLITKTYAPKLIADGFSADLKSFAEMLGLPATSALEEDDRSMLAQMALRKLSGEMRQ